MLPELAHRSFAVRALPPTLDVERALSSARDVLMQLRDTTATTTPSPESEQPSSPSPLARYFKAQDAKCHLEIPLSKVDALNLPAPVMACHDVLKRYALEFTEELLACAPSLSSVWGTLGSSVLRLWLYEEGATCREHGDPGIVTALLCGSSDGLHVHDASMPDVEWVPIERRLDQALVMVGQQTETVCHDLLPQAKHQVSAVHLDDVRVPRVNIILELRPTKAMWAHRITPDEVAALKEAATLS
eukprot:PhM_4_TR8031/c0_g1_i1/m.45861